MKLSIIVPVYNVEQYLECCIQSVIAQGVDDCEILLINDGSTDRSGAICDDLQSRYDCIHVVHQPNGGLSVARNSGLDKAQGEYITFVDSDDVLSANTLKENLHYLTSHPEVDILEYPVEVHADSPKVHLLTFDEETVRGDIFTDWIRREGYRHCYAWNKIYHSHLWQSLRFPTGEYYEDVVVMPCLIKRCHVMHYSSIGCYRYMMHQGTITTSYQYAKQRQLFENKHRIYLEIKDNPMLQHQAIQLWLDCLNLLIDMGRCRDVNKEDYDRVISDVDRQRPPYKVLPKSWSLQSLKLLPLPWVGLHAYCHCYSALKSIL
ncbi:MAG: glycosyltransferase family 2 protein [Bacteroidaceae bacterium]|nr:glycosyltransferase family 2 protein [Bacteroidaceae bacterium]